MRWRCHVWQTVHRPHTISIAFYKWVAFFADAQDQRAKQGCPCLVKINTPYEGATHEVFLAELDARVYIVQRMV